MDSTKDTLSLLYMLKNGKLSESDVKKQLLKSHITKYQYTDTDIAVISLAGTFPGASSVEVWWNRLIQGHDLVQEIPEERWSLDEFYSPDLYNNTKHYCRWGGFIDHVDKFDPLFFNISPREAQLMDPGERKMLEISWYLFERIGLTQNTLLEKYQGEVGVYMGSMYQQYHAFRTEIAKEAVVAMSSSASIANRLSYFYDFTGPSMMVDTMCSSSGSALHMACESLRNQQCRLALVGGVNLSIHPYKYIALCSSQLLSSDSEKRSFGLTNGFLPAESVAAVLLKPAIQAQQDGDVIYSVIKSNQLNHKGRSDGYTVPSPDSIVALTSKSLDQAKLSANKINYIETSMTGVKLANESELSALQSIFNKSGSNKNDRTSPIIGSVKSNMGHAEAAAGVVGLIKASLQLYHRQIPPTIKAGPSAAEQLAGSPFQLQEHLGTFTSQQHSAAYTLLNNFGASGVNCQFILASPVRDQVQIPREDQEENRKQLIVFSAMNRRQLLSIVENAYHAYVNLPAFTRFAKTLQSGRSPMPCRIAFISTQEQLITDLKQLIVHLKDDNFTGNEFFHFNTDVTSSPDHIYMDKHISLNELAKKWISGFSVHWPSITGKEVFPLPGYPFAQKRCWLDIDSNKIPELSTPTDDIPTLQSPTPQNIAIQSILLEELSTILMLPVEEIHCDQSLKQMGMNSISKLAYIAKIVERFDDLSQEEDSSALLKQETIHAFENFISFKMIQPHNTKNKLNKNETSVSSYQEITNYPALIEKSDEQYVIPSFIDLYNFGGYQYIFPKEVPAEIQMDENGALIIGAGPAGLAAAIALKKNAIKNVVVVEKRQHFSRMQMVTLYYHTLPYLKHLGILEQVIAHANKIEEHDFWYCEQQRQSKYHSVSIPSFISEKIDEKTSYDAKYVKDLFVGDSVFAISLADLQNILFKVAVEAGVQILHKNNITLSLDETDSSRYIAHCQSKESEIQTIKPKHIIIADGQFSENAKSIQISYQHDMSPQDFESWYIYHCQTDFPKSRLNYTFSFDKNGKLTHCAFGLFYPKRNEFGVAFCAKSKIPPRLDDFQKQAEFFTNTQKTPYKGIKWLTQEIKVTHTHANNYAKNNIILTGNAAGTGSPIAGMGSVLAISAYCWAIENYCKEWQGDPQKARYNYQINADSYVKLWQSRSQEIWAEIEKLPESQLVAEE